MDTEQTAEYTRLTGRWWELDTLAEVAQAVGMIAAQLDCPLPDAAAVLRGHSAAHTRDPADIAHAIVSQKLSYTP